MKTERHPRWPLAVAGALFVLSRLYLLFVFRPGGSDVHLYATYAMERELAAEDGQTLYQHHSELYRETLEHARLVHIDPPPPGSAIIEYPPLAMGIVLLPTLFIADTNDFERFEREYTSIFRLMLALCDGIVFVLIWRLMSRLFPTEAPWERALRLGLYGVASLVLAAVLYDRLDMILSMSLVVALYLLLTRRRPGWFLAGLAFAIDLKLIPLLLAPLLLVSTIDVRGLPAGDVRTRAVALGRQLALRGAGLLLLVGLLLAPFYAAWGRACLDFLRFHGARGIQIESTYASMLLVLGSFGLPTLLVPEFGAADILSPLSHMLARLSAILVLVIAVGGAIVLLRRVWFVLAGGGRGSLAKQAPDTVMLCALAALLAALVTSKVLSPQYVVWVVPFVALAPLARRPRHALFVAFIAMCGLTTAIFPCLYVHHVLGIVPNPITGGIKYTHADTIGKLVLVARNLLLVAIAVWIGRRALAVGDPPEGSTERV